MRWSLGVLGLVATALSMPFDIVKPGDRTAYDDKLARGIMLPLSGAAYSPSPQICLTNLFKGTIQRQVTTACDSVKKDTCSGFTAVLPNQKAIVISFRGTNAFLQLVQEADQSIFHEKVPFVAGGNVNKYFYQAFLAVWNAGMKDDFITLKNKYPNYQLYITGHSLGGAMASLAASYISATGLYEKALIRLVTLGQPRTGDAAWAKWHDTNVPYTLRITHSHDMVVHVPVELMGYSHHMSEVFFKGDMGSGATYTLCEADDSKSCSDGNLTDLSINDHLHYYDKDVSGYGEAGCTGNGAESFIAFVPPQ